MTVESLMMHAKQDNNSNGSTNRRRRNNFFKEPWATPVIHTDNHSFWSGLRACCNCSTFQSRATVNDPTPAWRISAMRYTRTNHGQ